MRERELKELLGKLTGIPLVKPLTEAMADVMGVCMVGARGREWHEYVPGSLEDVPEAMKQEFESAISNFKSSFSSALQEMGEQIPPDLQLIFAYYAKDPSIDEQQLDMIKKLPDPQKQEKFLQAIDFLNAHGLRMWMSPTAIHRYVAEKRRKGNLNAVNGSEKYFENFGYAWGAKKVAKNKMMRRASPTTPEKGDAEFNAPDSALQAEISDQRVVKVVTSARNQGYGIYFQDKVGKLYPVLSDKYYVVSGGNEDGNKFVNKQAWDSAKGQFRKFFGYITDQTTRSKVEALPTQTQFALPNGPQGMPVPIRKGAGDLRGYGRDQKFYLWIKEDGTLWWVANLARQQLIKGETPEVLPLTKEQVDFFNIEQGEYYTISNPDTWVYDWSTIPQQDVAAKQQHYFEFTNTLNEVYDYLWQNNGGEFPCVGLNAHKYVIIGPAFKESENLDTQETVGRMQFSTTHLREAPEMGPEMKVVRRADWVIIANEFNQGRAASTQSRGFSVGQSMDGGQAKSAKATLREAIDTAFKTWSINAPEPDPRVVSDADRIFSMIHNTNNNQAQPVQPIDPQQSMALETPETEQPEQMEEADTGMVPQGMPAAPVVNQQKIPVANSYLDIKIALDTELQKSLIANVDKEVCVKNNAFNKSSALIIRNLKRLG